MIKVVINIYIIINKIILFIIKWCTKKFWVNVWKVYQLPSFFLWKFQFKNNFLIESTYMYTAQEQMAHIKQLNLNTHQLTMHI